MWSNPARYAIVGGVGQIMMVLGELMIASGTTFAFYCVITYVSSIKSNVLEPIYLLIVTTLLFSWSSSPPSRLPCCSCLFTASPWTPFCSASSWMRPTKSRKGVELLSTRLRRSRPSSTPQKNDNLFYFSANSSLTKTTNS